MIGLIDIQTTRVVGTGIKGKISRDCIERFFALIKEKMEKTEKRLHIYIELEK